MSIRRMVKPGPKSTQLKNARPNEAVRFADVDFDTAINEGAFYLVLPKENGQRDDTVRLLSMADMKTIIVRDADRQVFCHPVEIEIGEKPLA